MNDLMSERQNLDLLERTYDIVKANNVGSSININPTFLPQEEGYIFKIGSNAAWSAPSITNFPSYHTLLISPLVSNDYYMTPSSLRASSLSGFYQVYEDNQEPKKGTPEYIKSVIGDKAFAMLSKSDKDFLVNSAGIFDLGENVDIEGMLKRLNDE